MIRLNSKKLKLIKIYKLIIFKIFPKIHFPTHCPIGETEKGGAFLAIDQLGAEHITESTATLARFQQSEWFSLKKIEFFDVKNFCKIIFL
jgi:hypothetical protein